MSIARKHSRKRDAILECLRCTTSHPTAEWIYTQLKPTIPDLSLATVYRNLAMFKDEGTIDSVGVYNGLERFDFRTDPHAHFICRICGAVSDINWLELPADTFPRSNGRPARRSKPAASPSPASAPTAQKRTRTDIHPSTILSSKNYFTEELS